MYSPQLRLIAEVTLTKCITEVQKLVPRCIGSLISLLVVLDFLDRGLPFSTLTGGAQKRLTQGKACLGKCSYEGSGDEYVCRVYVRH